MICSLKQKGYEIRIGSRSEQRHQCSSIDIRDLWWRMINHYLTDPDAWFLKTGSKFMKHFVRVAMKTSMEGDFETGNVRYKGREIFFRLFDPLGIFAHQEQVRDLHN